MTNDLLVLCGASSLFMQKAGKDHFRVTVPVCLNTTSPGIPAGKMNIESPEYVRQRYAGHLPDVIGEALGE